jgi:hypothetical protein
MLGWILTFVLLLLVAAGAGVVAGPGFGPSLLASLVFGFLLIVSVLARALRGQV